MLDFAKSRSHDLQKFAFWVRSVLCHFNPTFHSYFYTSIPYMRYEVIPDSEEERQRYGQGPSIIISSSFLDP